MFMRMVQVRYKPEAISKIREMYDTVIIPRLENIDGCLFVCAVTNDKDPEEGISLTLWKTQEHAKAYEKSGVYEELLKYIKPYLTDTTEWQVQLSKDMTVQYQPVEVEPVIETYASTTQSDETVPDQTTSGHMYLRLVSVLLQPGKMSAFENIYQTEILPVLRELKGCRFAFMTQSSENENAVLCVSMWDTRKDAEAYEKEGLFHGLIEKTKHTFSEFYQWKMTLEQEAGTRVTTSDDMKIESYRVVTGKRFE